MSAKETVMANIVYDTACGISRDRKGRAIPWPEPNPRLQHDAALNWLKMRAGWRDMDPAQLNLVLYGPNSGPEDADRARRMQLLSKMTVDEKRALRDVLLRVQARQQAEAAAAPALEPPAAQGDCVNVETDQKDGGGSSGDSSGD